MSVVPIDDPDVAVLAADSARLELTYATSEDDPWARSPFEWILRQPSRRRGAIGEALVAGWCAAQGFDVVRSPHSDADRIGAGHRVEIKMSTLWKNGTYRFQQIRDQEYDYVFCLGLSPFDAHAWLLPKGVLREHVIGRMGQHTGAGGSETAWIGFPVSRPYPWMAPYGDRLADVARLLRSIGPGRWA